METTWFCEGTSYFITKSWRIMKTYKTWSHWHFVFPQVNILLDFGADVQGDQNLYQFHQESKSWM